MPEARNLFTEKTGHALPQLVEGSTKQQQLAVHDIPRPHRHDIHHAKTANNTGESPHRRSSETISHVPVARIGAVALHSNRARKAGLGTKCRRDGGTRKGIYCKGSRYVANAIAHSRDS